MKRVALFSITLLLIIYIPASALDADTYLYDLSMLCEIFAAPSLNDPTYIEDGFQCTMSNNGTLVCFDNDTALYIQLEMPHDDADAFIRTSAAILYSAPYSGKSTMFTDLVFQFVMTNESSDYSIALDGTGIKIESTPTTYKFVYIHPYGTD